MTVILELFAGPIANILQVPAESFDKTVSTCGSVPAVF